MADFYNRDGVRLLRGMDRVLTAWCVMCASFQLTMLTVHTERQVATAKVETQYLGIFLSHADYQHSQCRSQCTNLKPLAQKSVRHCLRHLGWRRADVRRGKGPHKHTRSHTCCDVTRPDSKNRSGAKSAQIILKKYLPCTLHCCCCNCTQSPCKFRHLSHHGTSFCVPSSKGHLAGSPAQRLLSLGHPSNPGRSKKYVRVIDKL